MKTLYCFGLLFLATVYRFINCVYFLSVQIMFVICLADDVDSGLPFTSHWSIFAVLLQNYIQSGQLGKCSVVISLFQWAWLVFGVDLGKKKRKSRSRNRKCAVIRFLLKYWWKSYFRKGSWSVQILLIMITYHDSYFF